ncbi:MAG: quinone oxidoreductase, partial [Acidobacteriota bacterium]
MKAIRISAPGGPEVLRFEDVAIPTPKDGEALVRVEAIGVNFIEVYFRIGLYKPAGYPFTPGGEVAGVVEAVGPGVTSVRPGDRVATFNAQGAYAEKSLVAAGRLVPIPEGVSARQAAAAMLQGMTAHYLAASTRPLGPGDTCLVHAAAGGVGLLLCRIAKRRGARVIGTVSTEAKAALAREAGADEVILYTTSDFVAETKRLTGGKGVQAVYDSVGKTTFEKGLDVLAPRGTMALFGQSSGPAGPLDPQILNQKGSVFLTRPSLFHYVASREDLVARAGDVLSWVKDGSLPIRIDRTFPLAEAGAAHRALE